MTSKLFEPFTLRGVTLRNRVVVSPMCQYSANGGIADDWHIVQYGRFAVGGAGLVFTEATTVSEEGRITHGDLGIWSDAHVPPLKRIADFIRSQGAVPGIQISHAGRKASLQRPWFGNGPLTEADAARGDIAWDVVGPSSVPASDGYLTPRQLDEDGLARIRDAFAAAARRALTAGFEVIEVHSAHGYLLHQFVSPISNRRNDQWGGDPAGRMRFPLEVVSAVRAAWPDDRPVSVRLSIVDGVDGGLKEEDSVAYAAALRDAGVDIIACSSGGMTGPATAAKGPPRGYGFQVPYAARVRNEAGIATIAVGLIIDARQAEAILADGEADLIAIGREALEDPNWPLHARAALEGAPAYSAWPKQHGWWLGNRAGVLERLGPWTP